MTNKTHQMPSLFRPQTEDVLTEQEKEIIYTSFLALLNNTSDKRKIYGRQIIEYYRATGLQLTQIRLCKWVSYARQKNLFAPKVLIGSSRGYFLTENVDAVRLQLESLESRIYGIRIVHDAIRAQQQNLIHLQKACNV